MQLSGVVLWLHVLGGLGWVGASAVSAFAIAALGGPVERRDFVRRAAPTLNRICLGCAAVVPLTGIANLAFAAAHRNGPLPPEFLHIVAVKLAIFALMALMLWRAITCVATIGGEPQPAADSSDPAGHIVRLYGLMAAAGGCALLLGLWLAGV